MPRLPCCHTPRPSINTNGKFVAGEQDAMKVARPVRRGTDGKVPSGNSPAVYPTLICGDLVEDIRVRHSGNIVDNVIEGAYSILDQFGNVEASKEGMKSLVLRPEEKRIFANAALTLKYEGEAPIAPDTLLNANRREDRDDPSLWGTFNTVQENLVRGGQLGRSANNRRTRTRAVNGIGQNVQLNRALWTLAEEMKKLKAA